MDACIRANARRVRAEPDSSALVLHGERAESDPASQIIANVKIAIGGGINEPRDALLTILYGLLTHPDQLEAVRAAGNWRSAFEEGVRWVAPIQASSRLVMEDTEIRGCLIPKGDTVMTIQASANRDEDVFDDGENFNALREPNPHQAFGSGPHHCAGAHLSRRTVGAILLPMLFERFPHMTLPDPAAVHWHGFRFRGPAQSAGAVALGRGRRRFRHVRRQRAGRRDSDRSRCMWRGDLCDGSSSGFCVFSSSHGPSLHSRSDVECPWSVPPPAGGRC